MAGSVGEPIMAQSEEVQSNEWSSINLLCTITRQRLHDPSIGPGCQHAPCANYDDLRGYAGRSHQCPYYGCPAPITRTISIKRDDTMRQWLLTNHGVEQALRSCKTGEMRLEAEGPVGTKRKNKRGQFEEPYIIHDCAVGKQIVELRSMLDPEDGFTMAHLACAESRPLAVLQAILIANPESELALTADGELPLHIAAREGDATAVAFLLQRYAKGVLLADK